MFFHKRIYSVQFCVGIPKDVIHLYVLPLEMSKIAFQKVVSSHLPAGIFPVAQPNNKNIALKFRLRVAYM